MSCFLRGQALIPLFLLIVLIKSIRAVSTRIRCACICRTRLFSTLQTIHGKPDPGHVNTNQAPHDFEPNSALVYPNFIDNEEASALENDIFERMKRKRFEKGHWDAVITGYKEIEIDIDSRIALADSRNAVSDLSYAAIQRVRDHINSTHFHFIGDQGDGARSSVEWMNCHAIHLKKDGELTAHVDSVKFSGGIVAGLSLLSPSIMRLRPAAPSELSNENIDAEDLISSKVTSGNDDGAEGKALMNNGHVDLYLPPLSLYILCGVSRYRYTHELLPSGSKFIFQHCIDVTDEDDEERHNVLKSVIDVEREDRLSVIFRDAPATPM